MLVRRRTILRKVHTAAISAAVVAEDAAVLLNAAASMSFELTFAAPAPLPAVA